MLPYPGMDFVPFDILTAEELDQIVANVESLSNGSGLADGAVTYAKLLSTIFSGQVQTYTNTQSGGGTGYYINLGGLKVCYGFTGTFSTASVPTSWRVSLPSTFFAHVRFAISQPTLLSGQAQQYSNISDNLAAVTTSVGGYVYGSGAGGSCQIAWLVIGD